MTPGVSQRGSGPNLRRLANLVMVAMLAGCSSSFSPVEPTPVQLVQALPTPSPRPSVRPSPTIRQTPVPTASASATIPVPTEADEQPTAPAFPKGALTTAKAKANVGKVKVVCGEVVSAVYAKSSNGSPTFLNLDKKSKRFTIVIWREYRGLFDERPEKLFADEWVCIQGRITTFKGVPQIVSLGADIAHPSRFIPLTGEARRCLAKGSDMSIYCTIIVDEQRWENELYLDAIDAQYDAHDDLYSDFEYPTDDYVPDEP